MPLLTTEEVTKVLPFLKGKFGEKTANWLLKIIKMDAINQLYDDLVASGLKNREGLAFLFNQLSVSYLVNKNGLENIPKKGPFVIISNHPFGGIDGMLMAYVVSGVRQDFKLLANFLLYKIEPLRELFLPVNPFEDRKDLTSSIKGLRGAYRHINEGHPIGLFPAGAVSTINFHNFVIEDRLWPHNIRKLLRQLNVPIIPIHFAGYNSLLFYSLGLINPKLRSIRLPAEVITKSGKLIRITIGKAIHPKDFLSHTLDNFNDILRTKLYSLNYSLWQNIELQNYNKQVFADDNILEFNQKRLNELSSHKDNLISQSGDYLSILTETNEFQDLNNAEIFDKQKKNITYNKNKNNELSIENNKCLVTYNVSKNKLEYGFKIFVDDNINNPYFKCGSINNSFKLSKHFFSHAEDTIIIEEFFHCNEGNNSTELWESFWNCIFKALNRFNKKQIIIYTNISLNYSEELAALISIFLKENFFINSPSMHIKSKNFMKIQFPKRLSKKAFLNYVNNDFMKLEQFIQDLMPSYKIPPLLIQDLSIMDSKIIGLNIDKKNSFRIDILTKNNIDNLLERYKKYYNTNLSKNL